MNCWVEFIDLKFIQPAGTSRGVLYSKPSWILHLNQGMVTGKGEISVIPGLSPDYSDQISFEKKIDEVLSQLNGDGCNPEEGIASSLLNSLKDFPSILFGLETAWLDFEHGGKGIYFDNSFSQGDRKIPINGLVWMGTPEFMQEQIDQKLKSGFTTIKMKIGAIDLITELKILRSIREKFSADQLTLRVDANGAFAKTEATKVLQQLAELEIHSIEQPIPAGTWDDMSELCKYTPVPIALDEELIGITSREKKTELLETICPQYIIIKPSLHGGISGTKEWIELAEAQNIPWWMTSALESNFGLNAICQFTAEYDNPLPQGLGTGSLYENNFESDLTVKNGFIYLNPT
ncbi:MAG: o-succinylbenzoate synthase [Cryomorphaceae bacterium]|jgi:o-succinylbenzoate synthase|nr:o-succinylbenzoate synthase [Cryomorphaceae bacterium]